VVERVLFPQPIQPVTGPPEKPRSVPDGRQGSFAEVLQQNLAQSAVKFSAHAQKRLETRQINLTAADVERLNQAVTRAAAKGARDSLVLMDDLAFVVSVKNLTVVTAVAGSGLKENVFTNIDSAVIV
jgi:flagellar operon protein